MEGSSKPVLLAGATGFVGQHAFLALRAAGCQVVCGSRNPQEAQQRFPDRIFRRLDMEDRSSLGPALEGCKAVVYLVHQMDRPGYAEREQQAAQWLSEAAREAGIERIVYLGGVAPTGEGACSPHLRSRLRVGEVLRAGDVPTLELRAGMIVGRGSASWQIVRDLAKRLPVMVLPRWLCNESSPVAIDDVVAALLWALDTERPTSSWLELSGPEVVSHRQLLERVALALGKRPAMVEVPVITPELSSYWIAMVTRTNLSLARELVRGLQADLVPSGPAVWSRFESHRPLSLEQAVAQALADETRGQSDLHARLVALGAGWR